MGPGSPERRSLEGTADEISDKPNLDNLDSVTALFCLSATSAVDSVRLALEQHFPPGHTPVLNFERSNSNPYFLISATTEDTLAEARKVALEGFKTILRDKLKQRVLVLAPLQYDVLFSERRDAEERVDQCRHKGAIVDPRRSVPWPVLPAANVFMAYKHRAGSLVVQLRKGSLDRDLDVDAWVNSSNPRMIHQGGVSKAVSLACGVDFDRECTEMGSKNPLNYYDVRMTSSCKLRSLSASRVKHILHVVPPSSRDVEDPEEGGTTDKISLRKTYRLVLERAKKEGLRRLAVPALSCGALKCSPHLSSNGLLEAIQEVDPHGTFFELIRVSIIKQDVATLWGFKRSFAAFFSEHSAGFDVSDEPRVVMEDTDNRQLLHRAWYHGTQPCIEAVPATPGADSDLDSNKWQSFNVIANELADNAFNRFQQHINKYHMLLPTEFQYHGEHKNTPHYDAMERPKPFADFDDAHLDTLKFNSREEADAHIETLKLEADLDDEDAVVLQRWIEYESRARWNSQRFTKIELMYDSGTKVYYVVDLLHGWCYQTQDLQQLVLTTPIDPNDEGAVKAFTLHTREISSLHKESTEGTKIGVAEALRRHKRGLRLWNSFDKYILSQDFDQDLNACTLVGCEDAIEDCSGWLHGQAEGKIKEQTCSVPHHLHRAVKDACEGLVIYRFASEAQSLKVSLIGSKPKVDLAHRRIEELLEKHRQGPRDRD